MMGTRLVTLTRTEAAELADGMWDGVAAADQGINPPERWVIAMQQWIYVLLTRLQDPEANPGYEP
jgi:hypothetical protein